MRTQTRVNRVEQRRGVGMAFKGAFVPLTESEWQCQTSRGQAVRRRDRQSQRMVVDGLFWGCEGSWQREGRPCPLEFVIWRCSSRHLSHNTSPVQGEQSSGGIQSDRWLMCRHLMSFPLTSQSICPPFPYIHLSLHMCTGGSKCGHVERWAEWQQVQTLVNSLIMCSTANNYIHIFDVYLTRLYQTSLKY